MNYRLLCALSLLLSVSGYAHAELLSEQLSDDNAQNLVCSQEKIVVEQQRPEESLYHDDVKQESSWAALSNYTTQQIVAFLAGSILCGYGAYKAYKYFVAWYFPASDLQLTAKERDTLLSLTKAMGQDVKHARNGSRKPSVVKGVDMSHLGTPLDIECRYWQQNFVMLYNQCESNTEAIEELDEFYKDFNNAIQDLISRARIV